MNITQEKVNDLNAVLKVEIVEADYNDKVQSVLRNQQKKATMPGFRAGKVPFGMIKKMYGTSVKVEEINRMVGSKITEYISENKLNILGQPLPKDAQEVDFVNQNDFVLEYEMGLSPEVDVKLSTKDKFTYYNVVPDAQLVDNYMDEITMRYGKVSNPETVGEKDLVAIDIIELQDGELVEDGFAGLVTISAERLSDDNKKLFLGKKKDEKLVLDIKTLAGDLESSASLLNKKVEEIENVGNECQIEIGTISRMDAAELNQELFDKVYGPGTVSTVEEFRAKVQEEAQGMMGDQGKSKLKNDMIEYFLDKLKFDLPNEFMKKWLVLSSDGKISAESIEKDYEEYKKSIKWQVIENKLIQENDLKVEQAEVVAKAKEMIAMNFKQYGQEVPEEQLDQYAQGVLGKEEERRRLYDDLYYDKIIEVVKEKCKIEEKEIGYEAFVALAKEHDHKH